MEQFRDPDGGEVLGFHNPTMRPDEPELNTLADLRLQNIFKPDWQELRQALAQAPLFKTSHVDFGQSQVVIGDRSELSDADHDALQKALSAFRPWKKGPYNIFGTPIDSEWRSDLKWQRIKPQIDLKDKVVADIGCHNGYFMLRMLDENPRHVIGIEPVARHWLNFQLMQRFVQDPRLQFELLGVEHMDLWAQTFDTVFCLGILYHHTDPIGLLRKIHTSMKPGGSLIIDCQGIPGDEPIALMPKNRYTKARGFWWLPTRTTLLHWLSRTAFRNAEIFYEAKLDGKEQRSSDWASIDSLEQSLDPQNPDLTVEGYPAPLRFYVKCQK